MSIELSAISNGLKDYALDHEAELVSQVAEIGLGGIANTPVKGIEDYMQIIEVDGIEERVLPRMTTQDPLQIGGKNTFNPRTYANLKDERAKSEPIKVDLEFTHEKILSIYNTYMVKVKRKKFDPEKVPFEAFLLDRLFQDVQKYLRVSMYKSVKATTYNANTTSSLDIFNGFLKIIETKAATVNAVEINAITIDNAVAEFEKFKKSLPSNIRYAGDSVVAVSQELYDTYTEGYRKEFKSLKYNEGFEKITLDGTNMEIIVEPGLDGFDAPIVTTKDNFAALLDLNRMGKVDFDYNKRTRSVAMMLDFYGGVGIAAPELVWVGDITTPPQQG